MFYPCTHIQTYTHTHTHNQLTFDFSLKHHATLATLENCDTIKQFICR